MPYAAVLIKDVQGRDILAALRFMYRATENGSMTLQVTIQPYQVTG